MSLRFKRPDTQPPEIILVPFIDILLVVLIFMALSATFSRYAELQVQLPQAQGAAASESRPSVWVQLNAQGQVFVDRTPLGRVSVADLAKALRAAAERAGPTPTLVLGADARTPHQAVMNVLEAARVAGLDQITFMAQPGARGR
jgi:biopolymer transport protein ExbD